MKCCWCHKQIDGWYYRYRGRVFCGEMCVKCYLFEKYKSDIELYKVCHKRGKDNGTGTI